MQHWREANISYVNVTNSTNQSIVYLYDGVEVNATNMTAAWAAFTSRPACKAVRVIPKTTGKLRTERYQ